MSVVKSGRPLHPRLERVHVAGRAPELRGVRPRDADLDLAPGVVLVVERTPARARRRRATSAGSARTTSTSPTTTSTPALRPSEVGFAHSQMSAVPRAGRRERLAPAAPFATAAARRRHLDLQVLALRQRREEAQVLRRVVAAARERERGQHRGPNHRAHIPPRGAPRRTRGSGSRPRCRRGTRPAPARSPRAAGASRHAAPPVSPGVTVKKYWLGSSSRRGEAPSEPGEPHPPARGERERGRRGSPSRARRPPRPPRTAPRSARRPGRRSSPLPPPNAASSPHASPRPRSSRTASSRPTSVAGGKSPSRAACEKKRCTPAPARSATRRPAEALLRIALERHPVHARVVDRHRRVVHVEPRRRGAPTRRGAASSGRSAPLARAMRRSDPAVFATSATARPERSSTT